MIIKSMSRKEPSFRQLMDYIDRELGSDAFRVRHNVMGRGADPIRDEFERNARLLRKRKNGVYLYHEIISITRAQGLDPREQQELLHQIVQTYIEARCPGNLVYGGLHQDKDHSYHFHLMISANRAGEEKRLRLSKKQFRDIQVQLEAHVLQNYPELEQKVAIGRRAEHRRSRGAQEHERRTGRPPSRNDALRGRVQAAYAQSDGREALLSALAEQGFRHEPRGNTFARLIDEYTGKATRVKTLDPELALQIEARLKEPEQETEADAEAKREPEPQGERKKRAADEKEKSGSKDADYGRFHAEARNEADAQREQEGDRESQLDPEKEQDMQRKRGPEGHEEEAIPEQAPDPLAEVQKGWKQSIRAARTAVFGPDRDEDEPDRER